MLFVRIIRDLKSYQYKKDPKAKDDWQNNSNNSCLDQFLLYEYESLLFRAKCQTIANIPGGKYSNTIIVGPFLIKCFVEKRSFHCDVHGICQTATMSNEWITDESITGTSDLRWLIHDDQKLLPNPPNQITRIPWSDGCIVLKKGDLESFSFILEAFKYKSGDTIDAEVVNKEGSYGLC